jgi:hypothetical protein
MKTKTWTLREISKHLNFIRRNWSYDSLQKHLDSEEFISKADLKKILDEMFAKKFYYFDEWHIKHEAKNHIGEETNIGNRCSVCATKKGWINFKEELKRRLGFL